MTKDKDLSVLKDFDEVMDNIIQEILFDVTPKLDALQEDSQKQLKAVFDDVVSVCDESEKEIEEIMSRFREEKQALGFNCSKVCYNDRYGK